MGTTPGSVVAAAVKGLLLGPWTVKVVCPAVWSSSAEVGRVKRDVEPDREVDAAEA